MGNIHSILGGWVIDQQRLGCCISSLYRAPRGSRHSSLWYKAKELWWKAALGIIFLAGLLIYFYRLLKPADNNLGYLEAIKIEATAALRETELRGRLEKDKIGAVKNIFKNRLEGAKKINDREERLKALIRLHEELDI